MNTGAVEMETKTFKIPNIGCAGCVSKIKSELGQIDGIAHVAADPQTQIVTVQWQPPASWTVIESRLIDIDYGPADA
jgi:copper chaperone CopZ